MRKWILFFGVVIALAAVLATSCATAGRPAEAGQVEHLVMVKLKESATEDQITALTEGLLSMQDEIPGILHISAGVNSSPEGQNKGYNYGIVVRFVDEAARDAYLPHPYHQKIVADYGVAILEDLLIVDYVR